MCSLVGRALSELCYMRMCVSVCSIALFRFPQTVTRINNTDMSRSFRPFWDFKFVGLFYREGFKYTKIKELAHNITQIQH